MVDKRRQIQKICEVCNTPFKSTNSNAVCCSKICSDTRSNKIKKDSGYFKKYYTTPTKRQRNAESSRKCISKTRYNIPYSLYKKLTKECNIEGCSWTYNINLHHLDRDHKNISEENLIGLCPNHHRLIHTSYFGIKIEEFKKDTFKRGMIMCQSKEENNRYGEIS